MINARSNLEWRFESGRGRAAEAGAVTSAAFTFRDAAVSSSGLLVRDIERARAAAVMSVAAPDALPIGLDAILAVTLSEDSGAVYSTIADPPPEPARVVIERHAPLCSMDRIELQFPCRIRRSIVGLLQKKIVLGRTPRPDEHSRCKGAGQPRGDWFSSVRLWTRPIGRSSKTDARASSSVEGASGGPMRGETVNSPRNAGASKVFGLPPATNDWKVSGRPTLRDVSLCATKRQRKRKPALVLPVLWRPARRALA